MSANLLWAHLLRKDATTTDVNTSLQIPPIAPQDKTGTSMRMLIHDTQVNLEKFSARLDGLLQRVDDCRTQVVNANKLLDVERDKVLTEILEIVHKCQADMKAYLGTPAQATALDLVHVAQVSTERSVQALEKRIDALQALLQTHAHVMQSIQDQQNTLIGAILPLVPIVHGMPSQIDQIRTALSGMVANAVSTMTSSIEDVRSMLVSESMHGHGHARSSTRIGSSNKSMSSPRRKRSNASILGAQGTNVPLSSPLDGRNPGESPLTCKRARIEGTICQAGNAQLPQRFSRLAVPLTNSEDLPSLLQTPRTPRQLLAGALFPPSSNTSRVQRRTTSHTNWVSREYMRSPVLIRAGSPSTIPATVSRSLFQPLGHSRSDLQDAMVSRRHSLVTGEPTAGLPEVASVSNRDARALSKAAKIEEILEPSLAGVFSIHSSPLSSPLSSREHGTRGDLGTDVSQRSVANALGANPTTSNPEASQPKSMSLRDRRAQMSRFGHTETRRLIPLGPWSDEEE